MTMFLVLSHPFKEKVDNILLIINEITLLIISFLQLFFVTDIKEINFINYTGWVMISVWIISKCFIFTFSIDVFVNFGISITINIRLRLSKWKKKIIPVVDPFELADPANNITLKDTSKVSSSKLTDSKM